MLGRYLLAAIPAAVLVFACASSDDGPAAFEPGSGGKKSSSGSSGKDTSSSGETSSGNSSSGNVTIGSSCAETAKAQCAFFNRCIPGFANAATCERDAQLTCERQKKFKGSESASLSSTCLAAFGSTPCQGAFQNAALESEDCVAKGTLDSGAACEIDSQCKTGNCLRPDVTANCGTCGDFIAEGSSCTSDCAPGLHCVGASGAKTCVKPANLNDPCQGALGCAIPNRCVAGICTAPLDDGATCTASTTSTEDDPCTHSCQLGTCATVTTTFAAQGEACAAAGPFCSSGTSCHGAEGAKTCVVDALVGATCDDGNGPECVATATCVSGKCVEKPVDTCK